MKKSTFSVASMVTERVLSALNQAIASNQKLPWHKPYKSTGIGTPYNPVSKTEYRGINFFLLSFLNGTDTQFVTLKQANQLGARVKKGASPNPVIFFNVVDKENVIDGVKKEMRYPILKYYRVYNIDDVDGLSFVKAPPRQIVLNDFAEKIIVNADIKVNYKGSSAFYSPATHEITLPVRDAFFDDDRFYSTMFHELIHSTAVKLGRTLSHKKAEYAFEELVAELGSSMLCSHAGIDCFETDHTAAYIQSWIRALNDDNKFIIQAAQSAQKAVDLLLGQSFQSEET